MELIVWKQYINNDIWLGSITYPDNTSYKYSMTEEAWNKLLETLEKAGYKIMTAL